MNIIRGSVVALAGTVGVGVLAWPTVSAAADEVYYKRDDGSVELVAVDDDDNDDSNDNTNTGVSKATNDHTASNFTKVSRDRDRSRSDKTRDWTQDGKGAVKRDWSANKTNDRSRADTRR